MKDQLKTLFEYNNTVNKSFIETIGLYAAGLKKVNDLFSHVLNAHQIWVCRTLQQDAEVGVWENHLVSRFSELNENNYLKTQEILNNKQLDEVIHYKTSQGREYSNELGDILFHIINHSTHHRAQLSTLFSQKELALPATDYILYRR